MNKEFRLFIVFVLCLVIASCGDEHNVLKEVIPGQDAENVPFWEHKHLAFCGMKGAVRNVMETISSLPDGTDESYNIRPLTMGFNSAGQLTYYNVAGVEEPQTRAFDQELPFSCSYEYAEDGRMMKATYTQLGEIPVVYHLTYGEHTDYVPLVFPLGGRDFFLVKGLQSITTEDGSLSYVYDSEKASYRTEGWIASETEYVYTPDSPYPAQKVVTTRSLGGTNVETTRYEYTEDGGLLKTDTRLKENDMEVKHVVTRYVEDGLLIPTTVRMDVSGFTYDFSYLYNADGHLSGLEYAENKGTAEEITAKEQYDYLAFDKEGNWTDSKQLQSEYMGYVLNLWHVEGWISVRRQISYYKRQASY